jgi:predicted XRE-type DNA-binding protein
MSFTDSRKKVRKRRGRTTNSRATGIRRSSGRAKDVEIVPSSGNVFTDLGFDPEEAMNLHLRSQLMIELRRLIVERGLTQMQAAKLFGVTQPRVSNLMKGKIGDFSLDHLIQIAGRAGAVVRLSIERNAA